MDSASGSGDNERHNFEVFDVDDPQKYFSDEVPVESLAERGHKKTNPKHRKIYISKQKRTLTARKNKARRDLTKICSFCTRLSDERLAI